MKFHHQPLFVILIILTLPLNMICCGNKQNQKKGKVSRILLLKGERKLTLYSKEQIIRTYKVSLGKTPKGAKQRQGDGKTPEGLYYIDWRNPNSKFHLSLHISYPDAKDKQRAIKGGYDPGGDIMIHGMKNKLGFIGFLHRAFDWTNGCVAVTDSEIEEIWELVPNGTPIEIRP